MVEKLLFVCPLVSRGSSSCHRTPATCWVYQGHWASPGGPTKRSSALFLKNSHQRELVQRFTQLDCKLCPVGIGGRSFCVVGEGLPVHCRMLGSAPGHCAPDTSAPPHTQLVHQNISRHSHMATGASHPVGNHFSGVTVMVMEWRGPCVLLSLPQGTSCPCASPALGLESDIDSLGLTCRVFMHP